GDPGLGKSSVTLDLAARVTTGRAMPDGSPGASGGVVLLSAEDGLADTIRPRLDAAGADVSRVVALASIRLDTGERMPELPLDLAAVEAAIERVSAVLVVVDPLMAYLGPETNSYRDQDVRRALAPLAALAERSGAAVLVVRHLRKSSGGPATHAGGGSIGIIGAARSGLLVARDPEDDDRRILAPTKSNLGPPAASLAYRIVPAGDAAAVEWLGVTDHSAADLLAAAAAADSEERHAGAEAREWLGGLLLDGPVPAAEAQRRARADGIADRTLRRAREALGVVIRRRGWGPGSVVTWALPDSDADRPDAEAIPAIGAHT
ncbi:MAG: AAA family ATPase, partial [Deltaproteobacteria bacterium]|nr:AAA family ATPase [Deltaproteobacteria bacterium]